MRTPISPFVLALALILCNRPAHAQYYSHIHPEDRGDGWAVGSLEDVGIDLGEIKDVITNLAYAQGTGDFHSLLVARHGRLVVEQYLNGYSVETLHDVRSAGKTFTGTLVGIAIDRGLIGSTADPVMPYFSRHVPILNMDARKSAITVEDLLNMSSGLAADVNDPGSPGAEPRLKAAPDFLRFVLDLPMQFAPGERYQYNSATAYLAGALVEETSERSLSEFADQHLFSPLGIGDHYWTRGPNGTTYAMGGLYLTARDFAKLGLLFLQDGVWNGARVVSSRWVKESLRIRCPVAGPPHLQTGYGRFWLSATRIVHGTSYTVFYASGNGGNIMAIVPELDLLVSIQQSAYGQGFPHYRAFVAIDGVIKACLIGR